MALVAQTTAFVYIYVRIPQIAEMTLSFHATPWPRVREVHLIPAPEACEYFKIVITVHD